MFTRFFHLDYGEKRVGLYIIDKKSGILECEDMRNEMEKMEKKLEQCTSAVLRLLGKEYALNIH